MTEHMKHTQNNGALECAPCEGGAPAVVPALGPDPTGDSSATVEWERSLAELIARRPTRTRRAKTKAEAYQLDDGSFDEIDKDYGLAWILMQHAFSLDLWPTDRTAMFCEYLACALQAFPREEHAMRLAYAMRTVRCAHIVDILSFEPGSGSASNEELEARYGVPPADKMAERAALAPILERELGKPGRG
jgi:hypothetical protein